MTINLFDDDAWASLRPLTFTRPVADLRVGILTIAEKWERRLNANIGFITQNYLSEKYTIAADAELQINGSVCPTDQLTKAVSLLSPGQFLKKDDLIIAYRGNAELFYKTSVHLDVVSFDFDFNHIVFPEDLFIFNDSELRLDFQLITEGRVSARMSSTNTFIGDQFFAEEGASAECASFNSSEGPIYLGKNAEVWEGCHVRGSFALCHDSQIKMGSKIYGGTTIGPFSKVGGEVSNAVIWGYSSKGHDGYLGNAVLGQWCNIGADSNNSNLKNNYAEVRLWDYKIESFRRTGQQFCGLIMADHAKCGINTMFNTGTVAGVSANIFGPGFPRNFIPDFAWGGAHGFEVYTLNKMFETAVKVYERRNLVFDQIERNILTQVFEATKIYRRF